MLKVTIITSGEVKNMELALEFQAELNTMGAQGHIINLVDLDIPLFSSRTEKQFNGAELLKTETSLIESSQGLVFLSPEYNGGTPPSFNNFLAWLSRSSKNWRAYLNGKPAVLGTHSSSGGVLVLSHMRSQLSYIGVNVLGRQIHTHLNKSLDKASLQAVCKELLKYAKA